MVMLIGCFLVLISFSHLPAAAAAGGGKWSLLRSNIGVSAMHMQLLNNDRVVIFDLTDYGPSNISLPNNHRCRKAQSTNCTVLDCTAHSVEYDVASNSFRPLFVSTYTWCSSGATTPNGSLTQTGGYRDGYRTTGVFEPCKDGSCDWHEFSNALAQRRWYATNHIFPDGRQIIFGGRDIFSYEFYPKRSQFKRSIDLPFLKETRDPDIENNLYPFVFLNVDGNVFLFTNNRAVLFDYLKGIVVRNYPTIRGGDPRNYPSSGFAVQLPLRIDAPAITPEVLETMPFLIVMGDMVLLPNGNVLIINGTGADTAGWIMGHEPVVTPLIKRPSNQPRSRFEAQSASSVPRMYQSTAILLRNGNVLVSGSNPNAYYAFTAVHYPTDLLMESYLPEYLDPQFTPLRPNIVSPASHSRVGYGQQLAVDFTVEAAINTYFISVTMVAPPFTTHSFSMNQRLLVLTGGVGRIVSLGGTNYRVKVSTPGSKILALPGYYILFVVYQEVPSLGIWVQIR